jgi:dienelactone hydrolase
VRGKFVQINIYYNFLKGMLMKTLIMGLCIALATVSSKAQTWVKVSYDTGAGTASKQIEAVLRTPAEGSSNGQALLILHHAGGFSFNTTQQYGEFFSRRGFVTLELKMFNDHNSRPSSLEVHGQMMGGLKYLSQIAGVDPAQISAMGMSFGAFMTVNAAGQWFYDHYSAGSLRFKRLVALYPVCWITSAAAAGNLDAIPVYQGMPSHFLQRWAHIPLLILAAGKDSYDSEDPNACPAFVKSITDPKQADITSVTVYPNATHGWDHGLNYSFPIRGMCTGRTNCTNRIVSSPETVELGKQAVLSYLSQK